MATFTAPINVLPPTQAKKHRVASRPLEAWQLATIEWGAGQITGFVNKAAAIAGVPDTLAISDARIAPDGFKRPKREGDIESGVVPMQTAKVKLQDKGRAFSQLVSNKRANGVGLRGKVLRVYEWRAGDDVDYDLDLVGTWRLDDRGWLDGYKTLTGLDIRRKLKESIFEPEVYKLMTSITETSSIFTIKLPYEFRSKPLPYILHDERYSSNPKEACFYIRAGSGEIIKCPGLIPAAVTGEPYQCKIIGAERGALNTKHLIEAIPVDDSSEDDNKPGLTEWIYLEETLPNMIKMVTTGTSFDGRTVPDHWHIGMDPQFLDDDSLLYAAPELAALSLRAENYGQTTVKELIESEILPFLPATMQVSAQGAIQLRRITTISAAGANVERFDSTTIDRNSLTEVKSVVSHIKSAVAIRAGWDARTETFGAAIFFADAATQAANDALLDAEALILDSKLLHSSIHTDNQIRRLLPAMAEHYLGEKMVFSLKMKPTAAIVDVGNRVHVYIEGVPDDATLNVGTPDIDRSFLVTSMDAQQTGTVYQFKGTSGLSADYYDALTEPSLTDADYLRNATPLAYDLGAGAIVESGGVYYLQPGTHEVSFRKKYVFMDGPLSHMPGANIVCAAGEEGPMFQLWIPHAWHSDSAATITTTGKGGKAGGLPGQVGAAGYAVPTIGVGSVSGSGYYDKSDSGDVQITGWKVRSIPGVQSESYTTGDVPSISLSFNNDTLIGMPQDLSGYSGCGGGYLQINARYRSGSYISETTEGGQGATNSAGVMIICRGATLAPAARIIVNGEAGTDAVSVTHPGFAQDFSSGRFTTNPGSGSGPGTVMIGIDGPFTAPADFASYIEAYPGETKYIGERFDQPEIGRTTSLNRHCYYEALPYTDNLSSICSRVLYLPARSTVQEAGPTGIFSSLAISRQRDGQIRLIPMANPLTSSTATHPSDGDPGDIAIWQADLDGPSTEPPTWIMTDNYTWVPLDWATAASDYATLLIINREGGGTISIMLPTRPVGYPVGTHWLNSTDGTEWILGATAAADEPFRDQGVSTGDELIINGNFSQGSKHWIFTRNESLKPINILSSVIDDIIQAFITQGILEGEYEEPTNEIDYTTIDETTVSPLVSMSAVATGTDEITVSWVQQADTSGIASVRIELNTAIADGVTTSPHVISGLSSNTPFQIRVRNIGTNGNLSTSLTQIVTTQAVGGSGQLGITFTDTGSTLAAAGRTVSGTAYQDNESIVIRQGREITLTLFNGYKITEVVGASGTFVFHVPTSADSQLNKLASVYTNNGTETTRALTEFTYET